MNADFAMSILCCMSCSHLPSDVNRLPRYTNLLTCSRVLPWTVILHVCPTSDFENTVQEQSLCFAFFHYRIHQLLQLILGFCNNYCIICIHKVLITCPPILIPSISLMLRMIISVYKANRCGDATHPCRTPCLILIDSLIYPLCLTAACWFQYRFASSLTSCGSISRDCSNSISGSCFTVSKALL